MSINDTIIPAGLRSFILETETRLWVIRTELRELGCRESAIVVKGMIARPMGVINSDHDLTPSTPRRKKNRQK